METTGPSISVVVPSYGRSKDLAQCLQGIYQQTRDPLETIVVLRESDSVSRTLLGEQHPGVRIVLVDKPGQVAALNAGCAAARGEVVAITDDDAVPRPQWLERISDCFSESSSIGAVGGRDIVHENGLTLEGYAPIVGRLFPWGRRIGNHHLRSHRQDVDFLKGANVAFRATALRPFDTSLRGAGAQVSNDLEATWSVRRRGWRVVYDPAIVVDHFPAVRHDADGRTVRSLAAEADEAHNELYALLRHAPSWQRPVLLVYSVLIGTRKNPGLALACLPRHRVGGWGRVLVLARARVESLRTLSSPLATLDSDHSSPPHDARPDLVAAPAHGASTSPSSMPGGVVPTGYVRR